MLRLCWALLVLGHHASADIYVTKEDDTTEYILDSEPSDFGPMMPLRGMAGYLLPGVPEDGCSPLQVLPPANATETDFFVILRRADNCTPTQQVLMSQRAGFSCVIVHNVGSNDIDPMDGDDDVRIPSVFIGETNGILLQTNFLLGSGYYLLLTGDYSFTFFAFLVPAILLCMGCVFLLCCMQLFRCVSERRRARRKLLPQKVLEAIPTKSFQPGVHKWETCAICLEDYVEKDLVRILPCRHAFHSVCVDPWLTCTKRVCPICKRRVISATMSASCWDTDDEDLERLPESERRPLLRTRGRRGYGAAPTTGGTTTEPEPARPAPVAAPSPRPRSILTEVQVHNCPEVPPQAVVVNPQRRRRRRRRGDGYQRLPEHSPPRQPPQTDDTAAPVTASSTTNTAAAPAAAAAAQVAAEAAPVAVVVAAPAAAASASTEASGDHTDLV